MTDMMHKQTTPGTIPSVSKTAGMERTPRPTWVFIIKAVVLIHPT